jgi:putative ABC transport system substrate-binding protein
MRRREFITGFGGAVVAWPIAPRAQQPDRMRHIGVLVPYTEGSAAIQPQLTAFREGLSALGWNESRNVNFVYRWAGGSNELVRGYAKELVALNPDLILTASIQLVKALRDETRSIPILFGAASDPVELGLVDSLAHPGGNVTGFISMQLGSSVKFLELLKELDPRIARVLVAMNSKDPSNRDRSQAIESGGAPLNVTVTQTDLSSTPNIAQAIKDFATTPAGGLIVLPSALTLAKMDTIVEAAARSRLPAIYPFRSWAVAGGVIAYGPDQADQFRRAASYADRILRGAKPGDLPVQGAVKFDLIVNLKTAKALSLSIPQTLLTIADEVIE